MKAVQDHLPKELIHRSHTTYISGRDGMANHIENNHGNQGYQY